MLGAGPEDAGGESKCTCVTKFTSLSLRLGMAWVEANRQAVTKWPCARPGLEMARVEAKCINATKEKPCLARVLGMAGKVKGPTCHQSQMITFLAAGCGNGLG